MSKRKNKGMQEEVHKVPFNQKMSFGLSIAGITFISSMIDGAMLKYYTDFIIFPVLWFGIVQLLFAIINAINDPIIGYFSDRTTPVEGKGKRKRWLFRSLPLLAFGYFLMLFMSPDFPDEVIFIFLLIAFVLFDTGNAMNGINRGALMLTVTDDDGETATDQMFFSATGPKFTGDIDGDGKIGLKEAIHALKVMAKEKDN